MSEYIKRELAVSSIALETDMSLEQARKILGNVPSIDIVRCKECKHRYESGECELDSGDSYAYGREAWDDNWFCADGERREQKE